MQTYSSFTEAVAAARAGRQDGFSWLYEKTSKEKYYIAIKYMKNQTEAADVLQDAYMKAWQKLDTLDDPEKFPGWVGQIVANTALSALRKNNPLTFSDMSGENDEGEEFVYDIEDESIERQPELNYTTNERQEIIRAMIDSLSDEQRLCVMMFYVEEMSVKEIADTLGCSENTVKSRLNYGRKNIKAEAEELKKKGYNFYSIAPLPLLLFLLRGEKAAAMGGAAHAAVAASAATTSAGSTIATGTTATTTSSSAASSATGSAAGYTTAGTPNVTGSIEMVSPTATAGTSAAGTSAAATTGFFGTVVGKIILVTSIVAAGAGLGFGGYKVYEAAQGPSEPVVEAPVSPAAAAIEEPTPEPTPEPVDYNKLYSEFFNANKDKYDQYAMIYINDDDIPELMTFESTDYAYGEESGGYEEEMGHVPPSSILRRLGGKPHVFTIIDEKVVETGGWDQKNAEDLTLRNTVAGVYNQDHDWTKVYNVDRGNYIAITYHDWYGSEGGDYFSFDENWNVIVEKKKKVSQDDEIFRVDYNSDEKYGEPKGERFKTSEADPSDEDSSDEAANADEYYDLYAEALKEEADYGPDHYDRKYENGSPYEVTDRTCAVFDIDGDGVPEIITETAVSNMDTGRTDSEFVLWTIRDGAVVQTKLCGWRWSWGVMNVKVRYQYAPEKKCIHLMYSFDGEKNDYSFTVNIDGRAKKISSFPKNGVKSIKWTSYDDTLKAMNEHRMPKNGKACTEQKY